MMERLREAIEHCYEVAKDQCGNRCANEHIQLAKWLEGLQDFYALKEQGKLLELPCKVGDTVYVPHRGRIQEMTVTSARIDKFGLWFFEWKVKDDKGVYPWLVGFSCGQIGKHMCMHSERRHIPPNRILLIMFTPSSTRRNNEDKTHELRRSRSIPGR